MQRMTDTPHVTKLKQQHYEAQRASHRAAQFVTTKASFVYQNPQQALRSMESTIASMGNQGAAIALIEAPEQFGLTKPDHRRHVVPLTHAMDDLYQSQIHEEETATKLTEAQHAQSPRLHTPSHRDNQQEHEQER